VPEKDWEKLGELSEGWRAGAVAASREGYGLIGSVSEPSGGSLLDRMRGRRARIHRATASGLVEVWEGPGWVQALDCHGALCVAINALLKPTGSGSEYHLWMSTDGGREWHARGVVGAPSLSQVLVVSPNEVWVLGAYFLGRTVDGGATWTELDLEGERNPHAERLRRVGSEVGVLGQQGMALSEDGASWVHHGLGGARVVDASGSYLAAVVGGQARVAEYQPPDVRWLAPLPEGREPMRLATPAGALRLLTRNADPAQGVDLLLHASEDGGKTWDTASLPLGPQVDIADAWGVGVNMGGLVFGRLA
jgi:photosystem II stability/assembly factor-like uncharacterized protein